jgi:thiol-disulfide isomerase/thioredoxin
MRKNNFVGFVVLVLSLVTTHVAYAKKLKATEPFPVSSLNGLEIFAEGKGPAMQKGKWDSSKMNGKVVLVDFWASWCGPCKQALPAYDKLYRKMAKNGFIVLGVNVDDELGSGKDFLKEHPVAFPHVYDSGKSVVGLVGVETMPTSFLIGKDGKVHEVHLGFRKGDDQKMEQVVAKLLKGK